MDLNPHLRLDASGKFLGVNAPYGVHGAGAYGVNGLGLHGVHLNGLNGLNTLNGLPLAHHGLNGLSSLPLVGGGHCFSC